MQGGVPIFMPSDLGPLFSDLPQTVGRRRLYVGVSYQFLQFTKIGGQNIGSFNYTQYFGSDYHSRQNNPDFGADGYDLPDGSNTPALGTTALQSTASLKVHEVNSYVSFGITDSIEVSAVIPFSKVLFSMNTRCNSSLNINYVFPYVGQAPPSIPAGSYCGTQTPNPQTDLNAYLNTDRTLPYYPWYDGFLALPSSSSTVPDPISGQGILAPAARGIGDVTLRGKYEFFESKSKHDGVALGMEFRLPTGDPLNFTGSGAFGYRTFLAYGHTGRYSPHVNIGYQYNGSSVNDVRDTIAYTNSSNAPTFTSGPYKGYSTRGILIFSDTLPSHKLPNTFTTAFGLDYAAFRRVNLDADFLLRAFSNNDIQAFATPTCGGCPPAGAGAAPTGAFYINKLPPNPFTGTSVKDTLVFAAKFRLPSHFLLAANLQVDANPGTGMSYKPSPVVTLSYDFGVSEK
jgi:hypothetical protein